MKPIKPVAVKIHNVDADTWYWAFTIDDCECKMDKSAFQEVQRTRDVITMGRTVYQPFWTATNADLMECIECLTATIEDVMPQMGKIALQDYAKLNRGLLLSSKILKPINK